MKEKIIVLDFGGQYTQLIARSVRQCNVFSEIMDFSGDISSIIKEKPSGIILSGGPTSVYDSDITLIKQSLLEPGMPVLGICYGMQLMNVMYGGRLLSDDDRIKEYGSTGMKVKSEHPLFSGLEQKIIGWMSHRDSVDKNKIAPGFKVIGESRDHVVAMADDSRRLYGVQFHPEVSHTPNGLDIISNFVHDICGCGYKWTMGNYIEEAKNYIRETVGKNDVLCLVSGGVDSSFVAALLAQTKDIGNVYTLYIEALMRKGETEEVTASLRAAGIKDLVVYKAEDEFIKAVEDLSDPEEKRLAIANLFGQQVQRFVDEHGLDPAKTYLAQGTLYTDRIESGLKKSAKIKSHHNVNCPFIKDLKSRGMLVEPNRLIFKDEVREASKQIGLPPMIYERQPFPGPGLGIRIVDGSPVLADMDFAKADAKVDEIAAKQGLEGYLLPVKTVGVQGDDRSYSYLALLQGKRDWGRIRRAAAAIPSQVHNVNRVVYDTGNRDIDRSMIKAKRCTVSRETIDLLKDIDYDGMKIIDSYGFNRDISQTIFVLFGADIYAAGKASVALRAVDTETFMTVNPVEPVDIRKEELKAYRSDALNVPVRMSWECLDELNDVFISKYNVGAFVIDVTDKPPATTCWE